MARSSRIYVVKTRNYGPTANIAAFTVKRELINWIKNNIQDYNGNAGTWFQVDVFGDGRDGLNKTFEIKDVIAGGRLI